MVGDKDFGISSLGLSDGLGLFHLSKGKLLIITLPVPLSTQVYRYWQSVRRAAKMLRTSLDRAVSHL